jgi:integrase
MASFRQRGKFWYYRYVNERGKQVECKGHWDKKTTQAMASKAEVRVSQIRNGLISQKDATFLSHDETPLPEHINAWQADLLAQGFIEKHAKNTSNQVRRLIAVMMKEEIASRDQRRLPADARVTVAGKIADAISHVSLSDITREKVQEALGKMKTAGWSLQTCNNYRASIKAFSKWCYNNDRARDDELHGVKRYNAKEDRRHDRRTISLTEFRRLIDATQRGGMYHGLSGPTRALCYRTAAGTGLRFAELASVTPRSFDWDERTVTVSAAYTKNGETATLHLPDDLAKDLEAYVATVQPGALVFPLPKDKGSRLIRHDLKAAGIPYVDASGLFFDFHSLRCEMATLADAAGVSPRVVQEMMRASSLELVGRYTRPRAVDIEAAVSKLPSLKPEDRKIKIRKHTGTDN